MVLIKKKIKQKFLFSVVLFATATFGQKIWSLQWPSLFEPTDLIPNPDDKFRNQEIENITKGKSSEEAIRKDIYNSFHFISDFSSESRLERPRGWIDPKTNPQKALELGYPEVIKRKNYQIFFPVYPLMKLPYFKGDTLVNSSINVCQTYWMQSLYQETLNCFASLQYNIENNFYEITPIERMHANILQSFFILQLFLNQDKEVKNISFNTIPATLIRFKPGEIQSLVKTMFYYLININTDYIIDQDKVSNDIVLNYNEFFNNPRYLDGYGVQSGKKITLGHDETSVDPLTWIRSIMPIIYANGIGLNNLPESRDRGFMAIDKLDSYVKKFNFPKQEKGPAFTVSDIPKFYENIYLKPLNNTDLLTVGDLYKVLALQKAQEPDTALKLISNGILRNGDPILSSFLFKIAGDTFYDFDILHLARQSYSWSEMYSKQFIRKIPSALFFGAESAFWLGHYDTAQSGFNGFLMATGDKDYAPFARLRIATIEHLQGNEKSAKSMYEYIVRNLNKHPAAQDATVNLFCMSVNRLTPRVRKLEYTKVVEKIKLARNDLKRQAKACLMSSDLMDATIASSIDKSTSVVQKAQTQKNIIKDYTKEFPDSEFMILFSDRIKQLELSEGAFLASKDKCDDLITYYKENKKNLFELSKHNNKYVNGLKWSLEERKKLLRCSALVNNFELWKEARGFDVGKDGNPLQTKLYNLNVKPSSFTAMEMYLELKNSAKKWNAMLAKIENSGAEITNRSDFWELLSIRKFLTYEITTNNTNRNLLSNAVVKDLVKNPSLIFKFPLFCTWLLRDINKLSSSDLDEIALLKSTSDWLSLVAPEENGSACNSALATQLLSLSYKIPSETRDRLILLPFLKKKGFADASENWLTYAQRLELERGSQDKDVLDIYKNLIKETKDPLIKNSATMWLKKNFPEDADKILW